MKKTALKIAALSLVAVFALVYINVPDFANTDNFLTENMSFFITIIYAAATYLSLKDFSKRIAASGIVLLFFIYSVFAWALSMESATFTRSAIVLTQTAILIFSFFCGIITKEKTTNKIKTTVSKYIDNQVLETIDTDSLTQTTTGGYKKTLTIMFIDIRGFTTISEKYNAETVTEILNTYFKEIIPVITKNQGVINKFIGDALLVVFTGETPEIHTRNAVKAGKAVLRKLKNFQIVQESLGKEKITAGIGINTGEVFVGFIGTEDRCEYTVIGDTVNLANRTEAANRIYKTEFLITENTYKYVKDIADVIKISDVEMKGKREKVNVYEVLRIAED